MKITDLKVDNWYFSVKFQSPIKLTAEDFAQLVLDANGAEIDEEIISKMIRPISLTKKWLEKFGFKKEEHGDVMRIKVGSGVMLDDDIYELCWHKGDTWLEIFQDHHTHGMSLPDTLFVHEMQNLFKPLAGHELNLNEL